MDDGGVRKVQQYVTLTCTTTVGTVLSLESAVAAGTSTCTGAEMMNVCEVPVPVPFITCRFLEYRYRYRRRNERT
jgi:hypothetical protein